MIDAARVEIAEQCFLQGIVTDPSIVAPAMETLPIEALSVPARFIYMAATEAVSTGFVPDAGLLIQKAMTHGISLGPYTNEMLNSGTISNAANWSEHASVIVDNYIVRMAVNEAGKIIRHATNGDLVGDLPSSFMSAAKIVADAASGKSPVNTSNQLANDYIDRVTRMLSGENTISFSTGIPPLDDMLKGGWHRTQLHTLFALPGMMKSGLAIFFIIHAITHGEPVLFFSVEMAKHEVMDRLTSIMTRIPFQLSDLRYGDRPLHEGDYRAMENAPISAYLSGQLPRTISQLSMVTSSILSDMPLYIDDATNTIAGIKSRVVSHLANHETSLIVIDHMLHLALPPTGKDMTAFSHLDNAFLTLSDVAKHNNVAVLAITQPNRTMSPEDTPKLSHLAYAGERPSQRVIGIRVVGDMTSRMRKMDLHIIKHRNGPTGVVPIMADTATFTMIPAGPDGNRDI